MITHSLASRHLIIGPAPTRRELIGEFARGMTLHIFASASLEEDDCLSSDSNVETEQEIACCGAQSLQIVFGHFRAGFLDIASSTFRCKDPGWYCSS